MPRVMCVYFPHWSLQRIWHHRPDLRKQPLAITRPIANKGSKVIACCALALREGVRPGMVVAEALAITPALTCVAEDLDADRLVLTQLAEWAQRYSPLVGLEDAIAPSCLLIDTTGCADCFGGEEALVRKVSQEFNESGWTVRIALADTIGMALAHAACGLAFACDLANAKPQAELPVAALRLSAATLALLEQLGIERIEQLAELPRDQVAERFGPEVGLRLDQALGRVAEVITPLHPEPEAAASWMFDDPVDRHDIVVRVLDVLLERLQAILQQRHVGARLIECVLQPDGGETHCFECSLTRPARLASYLRPLLLVQLEQVRMDAPLRALSVRVVVLERLTDEQPSLFDHDADESALAQLLDSLTSRLGKDAVTAPRFVADPQPELACCYEPTALRLAPAEKRQESSPISHRPLRLLTRPIAIQVVAVVPDGMPQRFHAAGSDRAVIRCQGPERIETGWWRGDDVRRDYFMVETTDGTHWWIFHRLDDGRWFLHGCFD